LTTNVLTTKGDKRLKTNRERVGLYRLLGTGSGGHSHL